MGEVINGPVVIVLASGRGERFVASGGQGSKLDALLAGRSVLERTLDAVRASGLPWHLERSAHAGMGDSIAAAVRATQHAQGWLVLPGDLPLVQPSSLQAVANALRDGSSNHVVVPSHMTLRGHPVGFAPTWRDKLIALQGAKGAQPIVAEAIRTRAFLELALDDAGIVTDIDTLDDLHAAERQLAARS